METFRTTEKDGVTYELIPVKTGGTTIGLAPAIQFGILQEMADVLGEETVRMLAVRQYRTDSQNKVRAKATKDKVSASDIVKAITDGRLTAEMQEKALKMAQSGQAKDFTQAAAGLLGLGREAKPAADTIHWDVL